MPEFQKTVDIYIIKWYNIIVERKRPHKQKSKSKKRGIFMEVTDVLKGIEIWCTTDIKYTDYMGGFYKGSLNTLKAVNLITDETYDKYNAMINNKFDETFK